MQGRRGVNYSEWKKAAWRGELWGEMSGRICKTGAAGNGEKPSIGKEERTHGKNKIN